MAETARGYLPAMWRDWALPLYDPLVKLMGADRTRAMLIEQASIGPGCRALDIGCGTGTLAVEIGRRYANAVVTGLDPDPKALARARAKAARAGVAVAFDQGFADELPYQDGSFDRVFSSFMLHHVRAGERERVLREARRVLAPGGSLHLMDFVRPYGRGELVARMVDSGFDEAAQVGDHAMLFGMMRMAYFRAGVRKGSTGTTT